MTDGVPDAVARAFVEHGAFEARTEAYECTTTPFDAAVAATADGDATAFEVTVAAPTLSAAVEDDDVADVVEDGWYDTLQRRIGDAFDVARVEAEDPPGVERDDREVVVTLSFRTDDADRAVADAKALIDYVEGTYVQGIVSGYDYGDPVAGLIDRARETGQGGDGDGGGAPPL